MAENSKIAWTDHTFNPWIGCTAVSPACDHCYAKGFVEGRMGRDFGERRRTSEDNWKLPLRWNRKAAAEGMRKRVFCASMADVFDNQVPSDWRGALWRLIADTPHLDWLLLTKRPQNIAKMLPPEWGDGWPNVWLGTTVESQEEANRRIPHLLAVPAAVRFLSCEPLLNELDIRWGVSPNRMEIAGGFLQRGRFAPGLETLRPLDWIICGGESGGGFRQIDPAWARSLRDQCKSAGVAFFMKQMSGSSQSRMQPIPDDLMVREFPTTPAPSHD